MHSDIGRFLDGRLKGTIDLIKIIYDVALAQSPEVKAWVDGRELVFGKGTARSGPGFLRLLPAETAVSLAFPRGSEIGDPARRLKIVPGSRGRLTIRATWEIDPYVRRMIDVAYRLEA